MDAQGPGYLASQIWFDIIKETCWQRVQYRAHRDSLLGGAHNIISWSNYSDLTRPHPKWWFSKGNPLISGKSRLVKYYNLASIIYLQDTHLQRKGAPPSLA